MSDNGGLAAEPGWRDGQIHTQNAPLNSGKGSLYEGGNTRTNDCKLARSSHPRYSL